MINLVHRLPLHWLTVPARKVRARLAALVDLIAAKCHEAPGLSEVINKQIVAPLVRYNYPRRLGIAQQTIDSYLRDPIIRASLPKWWRKFAGFERWVHDGTCGHPKDWPWLIKHWPTSACGYRPPIFRVGQSMRETAKLLVKFGFYADDYLRCVEELKKKLIELTERPALVLPDGCDLEFVDVPPRRFGYSLTDVLLKPGARVMAPRSHGKREAMRQYTEMLKAEGQKVMPIPASLLKPDHIEAGDRESNRVELGVRDFPGFARRYLETGQMRRSVRMGENAGIDARTGALTCWIPEPEEAQATEEPPEEVNAPPAQCTEPTDRVWGPSPIRRAWRAFRLGKILKGLERRHE